MVWVIIKGTKKIFSSIGIFLYGIGLLISSSASSPEAHQFLNVLIGFGIAGTGFGPILAVVGRATSPDKRSLALGITTAAGSAGQVIGPPTAAALLNVMPWSSVFIVFTIITLLIIAFVMGFLTAYYKNNFLFATARNIYWTFKDTNEP